MSSHRSGRLIEILEELRGFLHLSVVAKTKVWHADDKGDWSKLWTSFDNVYDTQEAIDTFREGGTGKLGIFGLLQAMAVQQDAIMHIEQAVGLEATRLDVKPRLKEIRELRDETVGHPTSTRKNGERSNYSEGTITYTSMWAGQTDESAQNSLEYYVWSQSGAERKSADLNKAIEDQTTILKDILEKIIDKLKTQEEDHKAKFKDDHLSSVFQQTSYLFSKLYSYEQSREYSRVCLGSLEKQYDAFKNGLLERYGHHALDDSEAVPGIYEECKKLDEVLKRIRDRIMLTGDSDRLELDVYIESAQHSFEELESMAKETDETFKTDLSTK